MALDHDAGCLRRRGLWMFLANYGSELSQGRLGSWSLVFPQHPDLMISDEMRQRQVLLHNGR